MPEKKTCDVSVTGKTLMSAFYSAVLFTCIFVSSFGVGAVISAKFEADAYNRITGNSVSTWDAMFVDLRVVGTQAEE